MGIIDKVKSVVIRAIATYGGIRPAVEDVCVLNPGDKLVFCHVSNSLLRSLVTVCLVWDPTLTCVEAFEVTVVTFWVRVGRPSCPMAVFRFETARVQCGTESCLTACCAGD